jgi:putative nucleotidyltransferase with HDIG domain
MWYGIPSSRRSFRPTTKTRNIMKKKTDLTAFITSLKAETLDLLRLKQGPMLAGGASFLLCAVVIVTNMNTGKGSAGDFRDFEVGRVAERDLIAGETITFVDEKASQLRQEAQERLVPAIFLYSAAAAEEILREWDQFKGIVTHQSGEGSSREAFKLALQSEFPRAFSGGILDAFYAGEDRLGMIEELHSILELVLEQGIFALPQTGLERFNPDVAELVRTRGGVNERRRVPYAEMITRETAGDVVEHYVAAAESPGLIRIGEGLLGPFLRENVFYSPDETMQSLIEARARTEPVVRYIERGKRVIKKGFLITEDDMIELEALNMALPGNDIRNILSQILILMLIFGFLFSFCGKRSTGRSLRDSEFYLVCALSVFYIGGTVLVRTLSFPANGGPASLVVPTALVVMLPAILISPRLALFLALILPLGAFFSGSFDMNACLFALVSGVVASYSLTGAEKRMDLVRAGLIIGAANCLAVIAVLLGQRAGPGVYSGMIFWAAFNGIASGMMVLGVLPLLEHALNAATSFRLIELSDLNSPILRRLFAAAPGTYSHSIMVANLAEAACQDIGANTLLARVGAYYHDLGKMEQPDYFVENQTSSNKHDHMAPRLSATVIRSHVKLGIEKGRALGLPQAVLDIIGEHHGNSVITWFYNKALKKEGQVNVEDFSYPGVPPRSRESAVVMLADVTEAAVRTLKKPTGARMEKYIQGLFDAKVEHGQLARSDLTFRDLEIIKKAFLRVLMGHYHSRIEYPKTEEPRAEGFKTDASRGEAQRPGAPRTEAPRGEGPRGEGPKTEFSK